MKKNNDIKIWLVSLAVFVFVSVTGIGVMMLIEREPSNSHQDEAVRRVDAKTLASVDYHSVESIQERGVLKVGISSFSWAWFQEPGKTGKNQPWYGLESEYVKRFAKNLGVKVEYVEYPDRMDKYEALKRGEVDLVMNAALIESYNAADEYTTSISYTKENGVSHFLLVLRKDDYENYNSRTKLDKASIGMSYDESVMNSTKAFFPNAKIESYYPSTLMEKLEANEIDACVVYEEEYRNYFKGDDRFQLSTLSIPVQSQGMGVFFMKGNTDLKQFIDHEITDILESGISDLWNSENYNLAIEWEIIDD